MTDEAPKPAVLVSPGPTAGGGLKRGNAVGITAAGKVSPGPTAGGGLKQLGIYNKTGEQVFPPAPPPGAD